MTSRSATRRRRRAGRNRRPGMTPHSRCDHRSTSTRDLRSCDRATLDAMALARVAPAALLTDRVFDTIHAAIMSGELPAGTQLKVRDLADQVGTSVMPVREAIRRLEESGLAVREPHKGAVVKTLTMTELRADLPGPHPARGRSRPARRRRGDRRRLRAHAAAVRPARARGRRRQHRRRPQLRRGAAHRPLHRGRQPGPARKHPRPVAALPRVQDPRRPARQRPVGSQPVDLPVAHRPRRPDPRRRSAADITRESMLSALDRIGATFAAEATS